MDFKKEAIDLLTDEEFDFAFELIRKNRIPLQSVDNARRLSNFAACDGKTVKDNLLIRSGSLARISPVDAEYLKNTVGLSLIIDLRTPKEIEKSPDKIIPEIQHVCIPLTDKLETTRLDYLAGRYFNSKTEGEKACVLTQYARIDEVTKMYRNISTDTQSLSAVRQIFRLLLDANGAVLFHCTSGKDRTGVIAALILYVLGCDRNDILNDYNASAVTFFSKAEKIKDDLRKHEEDESLLKLSLQKSVSVMPEVMRAGFRYIDSHYTSEEAFILQATGFTQNELNAFRYKYLTN